jgi:hypothetical protein
MVMLPLRRDAFWDLDADGKDDYIFSRPILRSNPVLKVVPQTQYDTWMRGVVLDFLFGLFPRDWSPTQQAKSIGVDVAQIGRYRRGQIPGSVTVFVWLRRFDAEQPKSPHDRIYEAIGVSAAVSRYRWELNSTSRERRGKWRSGLEGLAGEDAAILYCLTHPGLLLMRWLVVSMLFARNLYDGIDDRECNSDDEVTEVQGKKNKELLSRFLVDLLEQCSGLFGKSNSDPAFVHAVNWIADIDLNNRDDVVRLLDRIAFLWNEYQVDAYCVINGVEPGDI